MPSSKPITSFNCLTFDCFGTLVDWETGIYTSLSPLVSRIPSTHPLHNNRLGVLRAFNKHEGRIQSEQPALLYSKTLATAYGDFAAELGLSVSEEEKAKFGASVGSWPAFSDTVAALQRLKKHYKLVILSNVDRASFGNTLSNALAGVEFDAIYTAQDIGSYKPDLKNFEYLIEHCENELGVSKDGILHTAQSLFHDHIPAKKMGLVSAWIERGQEFEGVMGGKKEDFKGKVDYTWHFNSMGEMADVVERAFAEGK